MAEFKRLRPQARFHLRVERPEEVSSLLLEGLSQIGLRYTTVHDDRLSTEVLCRAPVYAVMCRRHALAGRRSVSVRDLARLPLSLGDQGTTVRQLFDAACANAGLHIEPAYVSNHSAAFLPMLAGSDIVALSGYLTVGGQLDALRLAAVPFSNPEMRQRSVQAQTLQGRTLPGLAREFMDLLGERLEQGLRARRVKPRPPGARHKMAGIVLSLGDAAAHGASMPRQRRRTSLNSRALCTLTIERPRARNAEDAISTNRQASRRLCSEAHWLSFWNRHAFSSLLFSSLAGLALTCISGPAMSQASTKVLKDFTACDGSFFSSLHQDRKAWDGVPLGGAGNVSGIRVPDRNDKARNSVVFKRAINVNGMALTEYMDWYVDGKSLGKMLFWGFTISGRPAEVMERLRPLIKDEERLRKDGAGFMRAEVKIAQSPWVPAIVNSGAAAGLNKVERTLMIDLDESKNEVTVMCSLQGGLTAVVLKEVRPDMAEKEYPRELQAATFEDAPIPKDVAATAQSILAIGEAWKPKFKSLSYVERLAGANGKPGQAVKIELRALPDGLISKREIYGEMFSTRSLMLGNIALLKFQMVGMGTSARRSVRHCVWTCRKPCRRARWSASKGKAAACPRSAVSSRPATPPGARRGRRLTSMPSCPR
ncbi:LysR substrate-binding domain-containing protein [Achromobacter xylosoxidans]